MAITLNNVQNLKFLRNQNPYASREAALSALENNKGVAEDGTSLLARYTVSGEVKTIVGYVAVVGETHHLTVIDVEGASGDVEALRQEINAKLGEGITSENTATAQLAALSGTSSDASGVTSVWGAKAYADDLIATLDGNVTAGDGSYIKTISEVDGKISGTTAELPTVAAIAEVGKPIIAVAEDKGTIAASAGTIDAQYVNIADSGEKFTATTVEGALAELDTKINDTIDGLDYTGVTTGDGVVILNVTEEDGIVSANTANVGGLKLTDYTKGSDSGSVVATDSINQAFSKLEKQIDAEKDARAAAIDALDYTDTASAKTFVTKVDEADGVISTTKGTITSSNKTITLTDNADGGVDFAANVDGTTIIIDENTGTMSVASSALVQYEGDGKTIAISEVESGVRTVSSIITLSGITPSSTTVKEEYALKNASGQTIGDTIKIYKDSSLVSITYITDSGDTHYQNLEYVYIDASGNTQTEYVDMSSLVLEAEFASGLTIENHVARGVVDPTSETFLTVGADGFKLSGVQDAINGAVNALDADVSGNSTHVTVGVVEENGVITGVTVSESNIANADDLAGLSAKTVTALTSTNGSITASIDDAAGNKTYDIETDASKIKMSGFTAGQSGFTAITEASTVTEAVEAIEAAYIENEEVIASAMTDLNTRVDTVSGDVDVIKAEYISGVSVNGNSVTIANKVAPISISSATSAATATSTEAIVVDTDANGNITLGIATLDCGFYA